MSLLLRELGNIRQKALDYLLNPTYVGTFIVAGIINDSCQVLDDSSIYVTADAIAEF